MGMKSCRPCSRYTTFHSSWQYHSSCPCKLLWSGRRERMAAGCIDCKEQGETPVSFYWQLSPFFCDLKQHSSSHRSERYLFAGMLRYNAHSLCIYPYILSLHNGADMDMSPRHWRQAVRFSPAGREQGKGLIRPQKHRWFLDQEAKNAGAPLWKPARVSGPAYLYCSLNVSSFLWFRATDFYGCAYYIATPLQRSRQYFESFSTDNWYFQERIRLFPALRPYSAIIILFPCKILYLYIKGYLPFRIAS